jgi:cell wall-associated NlpC family hydrolase
MVVPPFALVHAPIADLRAEPNDEAELVDQVHYGESLRVLASREGWHYAQAMDHYFGWISGNAVQVMPGRKGGRVVGRVLAPIYRQPDSASEILGHLPAGTPVADVQMPAVEGPWVRVPSEFLERTRGSPSAFVSLDDVVSLGDAPHRPPTGDDLIVTAESFLGVPYLWGGTTAHGLDCSGLVQQVYRLNGVGLPRDADQQAVFGRPVERASAGDLLFFGEDGVTHVALALGETEFLHAPQSGAFVEKSQLGPERRLRAIRRYLPDVTR